MAKFKIKGKKESYQDENQLQEVTGDVKKAKIPVEDLTPKKKKEGKIIIRRKKGKADRKTEEDATNSEADMMLEKQRAKSEKKMFEKIMKGLK